MKTIDIKQNPNPKMRYELTLTIRDAPDRVEAVAGQMQFANSNEQCAPAHPISGVHLSPENQYVPFVVAPLTENVYWGAIYLDLLQDEDYYGRGVCHWTLSHVGVELTIGEATFATSISSKDIVAQQPSTEYLLKDPPYPSRHDTGIPAGTPASEYASKTPEKFFTATLTAREQFE